MREYKYKIQVVAIFFIALIVGSILNKRLPTKEDVIIVAVWAIVLTLFSALGEIREELKRINK